MQGNYPSLLGPGMPTLALDSSGHCTFKSVAKLGGVQRREIKRVGDKENTARKQKSNPWLLRKD